MNGVEANKLFIRNRLLKSNPISGTMLLAAQRTWQCAEVDLVILSSITVQKGNFLT